MSNAVDVLVCDGPCAGLKLCVPRPVPSTLVIGDGLGNVFDYALVAYENRYWVAVVNRVTLTAVAAAIAAANWQPSWDLLRVAGEHP